MDNFVKGDSTIEFRKITGEVLGSQKRSETLVLSGGGGRYVSQGSWQNAAPTIPSCTVLHHDFWLKTHDGRDVAVQLSDVDLPLREGQ